MTKENVKELLIKAKIHRAFAVIFLVGGLGLFSFLYFEKFDGSILEAITNPVSVGFFIACLAPAIFFTWRAGIAENKVVKMIDDFNASKPK